MASAPRVETRGYVPAPTRGASIPRDLAWLLDGADGLALDHAGKIAFERAAEG